jgi:hypothetical protein
MSSIDCLIVTFASWICIGVFVYFALNLDSEEAEMKKKIEKKILEAQKNRQPTTKIKVYS